MKPETRRLLFALAPTILAGLMALVLAYRGSWGALLATLSAYILGCIDGRNHERNQ